MGREWYPWFPHRFWSSERVALMDDAAVALYKFLLDHQWENGPFSSDERVLKAICTRFKQFDTSWPQVRDCFLLVDGRYQNERMEMERQLEREGAALRAERSKSSWLQRRTNAEQVHSAPSSTNKTNRRTDAPKREPREPKLPPSPDAQAATLVAGTELDNVACIKAMADWLQYKRERGQAYKPMGLKTLLRVALQIGPSQIRAAVDASMASNYAGIFPPKQGGQNGYAQPKSLPRLPAYKPDPTPRNTNPPKLLELLKKQKNGAVEVIDEADCTH
jgi:uncharacterized protein YdaU (DUF1376 family)